MQFYQKSKKTCVFRVGQPFATEAVVSPPEAGHFSPADFEPSLAAAGLPPWRLSVEAGQLVLRLKVKPTQLLWGLGQQVGGLNRHGQRFDTYCTDEFNHLPDKKSLYGAHTFLLLPGKKGCTGLFLDFPGRTEWDLGFTDPRQVVIKTARPDADLWFFRAASPLAVIKEYLRLTGSPYLPPRRGFGFQQSRWAYPDEASVRAVVRQFREADLPLDGINLDIDYMEDFRVFTVSRERFPDLAGLVRDLKAEGVWLTPIIDPGVQIRAGLRACDEGLAGGHFAQTAEGKPFVATVWPGECHLPDFQRPETRAWWGSLYGELTKLGIESFWNDMNEPALFFTPRGLKEFFDRVERIKHGAKIGIYEFFELNQLRLANQTADYQAMQQADGQGGLVSQDSIHNLYGLNMSRAAAEGLKRLLPGKRPLLYTRASAAGAHRYTGVWTGDNASWWEHLVLHLKMVTSLHMSGFLYSGADVGGFGGDASGPLVVRWSQLGVFTPLFRNHSALGTRPQEPYSFTSDITKHLRRVLKLRYALLPWLYSEFMKAARGLKPLWRPLGFHFDDDLSRRTEDQVLVGGRLMIAPVYQPNAEGRSVYLPKTPWLALKFKTWDNYQTQVLGPGLFHAPCGLGETLAFLRPDSLLALTEPGRNEAETQPHELHLIGFIKTRAVLKFYEDDGESTGTEFSLLVIEVERRGAVFQCRVRHRGQRPSLVKRLWLDLHGPKGIRQRGLLEVELAEGLEGQAD